MCKMELLSSKLRLLSTGTPIYNKDIKNSCVMWDLLLYDIVLCLQGI